MANSKPASRSASSPKPSSPASNPNYPSSTGKPSGAGRGNTPKK